MANFQELLKAIDDLSADNLKNGNINVEIGEDMIEVLDNASWSLKEKLMMHVINEQSD